MSLYDEFKRGITCKMYVEALFVSMFFILHNFHENHDESKEGLAGFVWGQVELGLRLVERNGKGWVCLGPD